MSVIIDPSTKKRYLKGQYLGKGSFARCYELTDLDTNKIYAGKIVFKSRRTTEEIDKEIAIHRHLNHRHVVGLIGDFEDSDTMSTFSWNCAEIKYSLQELQTRRRAITEPETRYFVYQIIEACKYLHENRVIHRDLKLLNIFLDEEMKVKIGDFGFAAKLDFDGERKKTLLGTFDYIAPEVLDNTVGKPPFRTTTVGQTFARIEKNEYHVPSHVSASEHHVIARLLSADPTQRPSVFELLGFDFFTKGYMPSRLPISCLTMAPKFPSQPNLNLGYGVRKALKGAVAGPKGRKGLMAAPLRTLNAVPENQEMMSQQENGAAPSAPGGAQQMEMVKSPSADVPTDYYLSDLYKQLTQLCFTRPDQKAVIQEDEAEDPAGTPVFWIAKWVDYSDKYGLGYQLCDNSVGVLFKDGTKLVLDGAGEQIQYTERDNTEAYFTMPGGDLPEALTKKITILKYFRNYMKEHLLKAGANMAPKEGDELARLPCLRTWFKVKKSSIILHLTNGTLQLNFFQDHTKIILCPLMQAVTYVSGQGKFKTFRFSLLEQFGCGKELAERLKYARKVVERLLTTSSHGLEIEVGLLDLD